MKDRTVITFDYEDFTGARKHGTAEIRVSSSKQGFAVCGTIGYGKTKDDIGEALRDYLGGRNLLSYRIFD